MTKRITSDNRILAKHAAAIRRLGKRVVADVIEIGRRLTEAKPIAGHGNWLAWLEREFKWTEMTATRFINVYEMSKSNNLLDLELPISGALSTRRAKHVEGSSRRDHRARASGRDGPGRRGQTDHRARQGPHAEARLAR
jgi:DUF3102 family protein